jgi:hypothetical protein
MTRRQRWLLHSFALGTLLAMTATARADELWTVPVETAAQSMARHAPKPVIGEALAITRPGLRDYAYQMYPRLARCIEAIVMVESSGWVTYGWNPMPWGRWGEHASGLGGFLPSTWATTPQGRAGYSIWDGYAQVEAIAWMLSVGRGREFAAYAWGRC